MQFETITSRDNRLVKDTVKLLSSAKARKDSGLFVLEGLRVCRDAARCGMAPVNLFFTEAILSSHAADITEIAAVAQNCYCISDVVCQKLSDTQSPQGVFCVMQIPKQAQLLGTGKYIGLENVADPANLGAVARTAEALGIDGIILFGSGCDPYAPKAQRAAMGALLRIPVYRMGGFSDFIETYPAVKTYAAVVEGGSLPR